MVTKRRNMPYGPPPSWLPDWTDKDAYLHVDYTPCLWAWEFLRRNQDYQADYQKWVAEDYSRGLEDELCEKWGIAHLNDPGGSSVVIGRSAVDEDAMPPLFLDFESEDDMPPDGVGVGGHRVSLRCGSGLTPTDSCRQFFVRFDVRYPLDRQIAAVEKFYRARRQGLEYFRFLDAENPQGPQLPKLPDYLRVYDAKWKGVAHKAIAQKLFPQLEWVEKGSVQKRIENSLSKARRLVEHEYRNLLTWA